MRHTLRLAVLSLLVVLPAAARAQATDSARKITQAGKGGPTDSVVVVRDAARKAMDIFGDSLAPARDTAAVTEPTWDIDVRSYETRDRVAHFVGVYSGRAKERVMEWLERGSRYEPMIRAKLRAGGLPEDMYYLALVESGFDTQAYSRAAAVGMWQFMTSTARDMGLRVDWWVDERRDPVRSTGAAVRFIRGLRDQFGSLYLAAAAYNGGPGRVARGMARYADDVRDAESEDRFFVLADKDYLRHETRDYVPQLIAAALIAKEPARYGMEFHPQPAFAYDSVSVPESTPLAAVATAAGTDVRTVLDLNPHFLRGMTPPRDASTVRIPVGAAAGFDSAFASLPKQSRIATKGLETKKGDTPERIANAHGITVTALRAFNPAAKVLKSGRYSVDQALTVPEPEVASAMRIVPDPAIERYSRSGNHSRVHTVAKGETIGGIAKRYSISSDRLMKLNGLRKPMIFPGQSLIVASGKPATSTKAKATGRRAPVATGSKKKSPAAGKHSGGRKPAKKPAKG